MAIDTTVIANSGSSVSVNSDLYRLLASGILIEYVTLESATVTSEVMLKNISDQSGNGKAYKRKGGLGYHIASSPGDFPAKDSGDLAGSVNVSSGRSAEEADILIESDYALDLENGTSKMRARPFILRSVNEALSTRLPEIFNKVVSQIELSPQYFENQLSRIKARARGRLRSS